MFSKLRILSIALTLAFSSTAFADLAIIGHPDSEVGDLDTQKVKKLFLGERKSFPNGLHATPMNHVKGSPDRKEFFASVLNLSLIHISEPTRLVHSSRMPSSA